MAAQVLTQQTPSTCEPGPPLVASLLESPRRGGANGRPGACVPQRRREVRCAAPTSPHAGTTMRRLDARHLLASSTLHPRAWTNSGTLPGGHAEHRWGQNMLSHRPTTKEGHARAARGRGNAAPLCALGSHPGAEARRHPLRLCLVSNDHLGPGDPSQVAKSMSAIALHMIPKPRRARSSLSRLSLSFARGHARATTLAATAMPTRFCAR